MHDRGNSPGRLELTTSIIRGILAVGGMHRLGFAYVWQISPVCLQSAAQFLRIDGMHVR